VGRSGWNRLKSLRDIPEEPIYVRNVTDQLISWRVYEREDFVCDWEHRNRMNSREFRIDPGETVNLRDIFHDEVFHTSLILHWHVNTKRLIVLNDTSWFADQDDHHRIQLAIRRPPKKRSSRYYAVRATRRKNVSRDSR
jgi:hypothetical protein